jgi:hypothetical protein
MASGGALVGVAALAAALGLVFFLPYVVSGALLLLGQIAAILAGFFMAFIGLWAVLVSFGEVGNSARVEVSKAALCFNDLQDPSGAEAKFAEREIALDMVNRISVEQGWLARLFGYGDIAVFTSPGAKPSAVIRGIARPHAFKEKLELILLSRAVPASHVH